MTSYISCGKNYFIWHFIEMNGNNINFSVSMHTWMELKIHVGGMFSISLQNRLTLVSCKYISYLEILFKCWLLSIHEENIYSTVALSRNSLQHFKLALVLFNWLKNSEWGFLRILSLSSRFHQVFFFFLIFGLCLKCFSRNA